MPAAGVEATHPAPTRAHQARHARRRATLLLAATVAASFLVAELPAPAPLLAATPAAGVTATASPSPSGPARPSASAGASVSPGPSGSPGPSEAPGSPTPSPTPVPSPSILPGLLDGSPSPEIVAAAAACEAQLSAATLTTAMSQPAILISAVPQDDKGLPDILQCGYRLADGTTFSMTARWEVTVGPNRSSASADWGPSARGTSVSGLPAPAYTAVLTEDIERRGLAWTPVIGPGLTLVLDVEAWLPDGSYGGIDLLTAFARAQASQPAAPRIPDPACTKLLPVKADWSQSWSPGPGEITCGYDLGGGTAVTVSTSVRNPGRLPTCCQWVPELGRAARARPVGGRKDPGWRLDWVLRGGSPTLTGTIENAPTARERIGKAGLILLAKRVVAPAAKGSKPHRSAPRHRPRRRRR
ncbi:MAG: hypothetical protein U0869_15105 [Chloroflexota bacterium]